MDVGHKVFRTLGQIQNGFQPDDLRTGGLNGGVLQGKELQVAKLFRRVALVCMQGEYLLEPKVS